MRTTLLSLLLIALMALAGAPARANEVELLDLGNGVQGNAYFSPYEELDLKVLEILDKAEPGSTVYQSYYSLSYTPYFWKYADLNKRGVKVKVNLWSGSFGDSTDSRLKKAGVDNAWILNIRRPPPEAWSSMHTKITVVNEEWVITGSANLSNSASLANHEHIIILRSRELAREFIKEFEEQRAADAVMREYEGEIDGDTDPDYREMMKRLNKGPNKIDKPTVNDSTTLQTYFSPDDQLQYRVIDEVKKAKRSIKVAMYTFFSPTIAYALADAADDGVKVMLLLDSHQHEHNDFAEHTLKLLRDNPNVQIVLTDTSEHGKQLGNYASLHHKYAIIDDETVLGGSFNWTGTAHQANDENMTVIHSAAMADRFNTDYASIIERYEPERLEQLRADGFMPAKTHPGDTTRVLFAVSYTGTDAKGKNAWDYDTDDELVVVGNVPELGDGDPAKGLILRGSQSVSPRMLGSINLPRGTDLEWRVVVRSKQGNQAGAVTILSGNTTTTADAKNKIEAGARALSIDMSGTPMIVGPFRPENLKTTGSVSWNAPSSNKPTTVKPHSAQPTFPGAGTLGGH